ncbi:hypothetical protein [Halobacillus sp. H74]|uniref:hypothetical protein n=1 Tax=Halobacillus sp. H74 TaxID=3457436 RepID=UPI003FCC7583
MKEYIVPSTVKTMIQDNVPVKLRLDIVKGVKKAYKIVYQLVEDIPLFNWEIGEYHIGYLKHIAVQYVIQKDIQFEDYEFKTSIQRNVQGYPYLVLHNDNCEITISQTSSPEKIARPAYFREKKQQVNQIRLNLFDENTQSTTDSQSSYFLLSHGYQTKVPEFINLGMPNEYGWIERINLIEQPFIVEDELENEEKINEETLVGFKDYLKGVETGE